MQQAPELKRLDVNANALDQKSIADRKLPDPKLMAGTLNVPTNTFSFTQDDMTMIMGGLEQHFPPGHSLAIKSRQTKAQAIAILRRLHEQALPSCVRQEKLGLNQIIQTRKNR